MKTIKKNNNRERESADLVALRLENETLAQQIRRLIKAESRLYAYQEQLDAQLREYKGLYDLNRKLIGTFDFRKMFEYTCEYVINGLEYERVLIFLLDEETCDYTVSAIDGYYEAGERERVAGLVIKHDEPILTSLYKGDEYLICGADTAAGELADYRQRLAMNEFLIYPLASHAPPLALLAVGNTAENAGFYHHVGEDEGSLFVIGNLVGLLASSIENRILYKNMDKAFELVKQAEAKYRNIFENAAEGIFQTSVEGKFISCNPATAAILGYESPDDLMTCVTDIARLYVNPERREELLGMLRNRENVKNFEVEFYRKDGKRQWALLSINPTLDEEGDTIYLNWILLDIAERKRAEEALRLAHDELEKRVAERTRELRERDQMLIMQSRQAAMGEMIGNIAHQWRQPLNNVGMIIQTMKLLYDIGELNREKLVSSERQVMEMINYMSQTIDDFRNFFRPDKEKVSFSVREGVEKALSLIEASFKNSFITTKINMEDQPVVVGFQSEYSQVLLAILQNAKEALAACNVRDPQVTITVREENGKSVVTIADNAGGIPDDIIQKVFDPYFTTKGPDKGTGIGLFMSKAIIENNMGGRLTVRNTSDGAEFRIEV